MSDERFRILLIEDNPDDARLVREMLAYAKVASFDVECVDRLSAGLERLDSDGFDVVLLDLGLLDGQEPDALTKTCAQAPDVPIVVLTGIEDDKATTVEVLKWV